MPLWFEDMQVGRVDTFGNMPVEREAVLDFARKFDPQPFHLDDAAAAANPVFGRLAASGWHTAAMAMRMTVDKNADTQETILGGAGVEQLNWLRPVYPGDVLRCAAEVLAARPLASRPGTGLVTIRTTVFNQEDAPVMDYIAKVMMRMRPEGV